MNDFFNNYIDKYSILVSAHNDTQATLEHILFPVQLVAKIMTSQKGMVVLILCFVFK